MDKYETEMPRIPKVWDNIFNDMNKNMPQLLEGLKDVNERYPDLFRTFEKLLRYATYMRSLAAVSGVRGYQPDPDDVGPDIFGEMMRQICQQFPRACVCRPNDMDCFIQDQDPPVDGQPDICSLIKDRLAEELAAICDIYRSTNQLAKLDGNSEYQDLWNRLNTALSIMRESSVEGCWSYLSISTVPRSFL